MCRFKVCGDAARARSAVVDAMRRIQTYIHKHTNPPTDPRSSLTSRGLKALTKGSCSRDGAARGLAGGTGAEAARRWPWLSFGCCWGWGERCSPCCSRAARGSTALLLLLPLVLLLLLPPLLMVVPAAPLPPLPLPAPSISIDAPAAAPAATCRSARRSAELEVGTWSVSEGS